MEWLSPYNIDDPIIVRSPAEYPPAAAARPVGRQARRRWRSMIRLWWERSVAGRMWRFWR